MKNQSEKFSSLSDLNDVLTITLSDDLLTSSITNEDLSIVVQRTYIKKVIKL